MTVDPQGTRPGTCASGNGDAKAASLGPTAGEDDAAAVGTSPTLSSHAVAASAASAPTMGPAETQPAAAGATLPPDTGHALADLVGQTLAGRYTILGLLGSGGMSLVYLARHELLKKMVAIKVLREHLAQSKSSLSRFHREAMAAASIGDPHIVDITDYGFTERGDAFIVMERLEGQSLRQALLAEGALPFGRSVAIARQTLRALGAAHARGIVHRDLKPENVFLCARDGHDFVKLLDFGVSKVLQPLEESDGVVATGTGVVLGTPQYIAPEQAHGLQGVDHRVDIYAMGVMLYEMLTGVPPFTGTSGLEVLIKHVQDEPEPPRQKRPDLGIPEELERVVLRAMSKDPKDRFPSAEEMLRSLPDSAALPGGYPSGSLLSARTTASARLGVPARHRRWLWPAAAVGGLIVVGAVGGLVLSPRRPLPAVRPSVPPINARVQVVRAPDARAVDVTSRVTVTIRVQPGEAQILLDEEILGIGTAQKTAERGQRLEFKIVASGFRSKDVIVVPEKDQEVLVELIRRRPHRRVPQSKQRGAKRPTPGDRDKRSPDGLWVHPDLKRGTR